MPKTQNKDKPKDELNPIFGRDLSKFLGQLTESTGSLHFRFCKAKVGKPEGYTYHINVFFILTYPNSRKGQ